jgi:hypothetical protein
VANEVIQALSTAASAVSAVVGIVGALRNRHDKTLRATTWALVGVASVGLTVYFMVSLARGWLESVRVVARQQAIRSLKDESDKAVAALMADIGRKDERIAQLEAQLPAVRRTGNNGGPAQSSTADGLPTAAAAPQSCPLNDTWECAKKLAVGQKDSDEFRARDQERYYYFDVAAPRALTVTVDPVPSTRHVVLTIHDADRREISRQSFAERHPGSLDTRVRAAGRYYIKLRLGFCCVSAADPYTIVLSS